MRPLVVVGRHPTSVGVSWSRRVASRRVASTPVTNLCWSIGWRWRRHNCDTGVTRAAWRAVPGGPTWDKRVLQNGRTDGARRRQLSCQRRGRDQGRRVRGGVERQRHPRDTLNSHRDTRSTLTSHRLCAHTLLTAVCCRTTSCTSTNPQQIEIVEFQLYFASPSTLGMEEYSCSFMHAIQYIRFQQPASVMRVRRTPSTRYRMVVNRIAVSPVDCSRRAFSVRSSEKNHENLLIIFKAYCTR